MRHAATFALGALCGVLLALLLTQPSVSRAPSAPRASVQADFWRVEVPVRTPEVPTLRPSSRPPGVTAGTRPALLCPAPCRTEPATPTIESGLASANAVGDPVPTPTPTPKPTKRPRAATRPADGLSGVASYVRASLGADYLAARLPKGTRLRVCGPAGCITGVVNDYGPSKRIHPERIVDLSAADFAAVCGALSMGVCEVEIRW